MKKTGVGGDQAEPLGISPILQISRTSLKTLCYFRHTVAVLLLISEVRCFRYKLRREAFGMDKAKAVADKYISPTGGPPAVRAEVPVTPEAVGRAMRPPMHFPDWSGFGPKVLALRERERRFVWAYLIICLTEGKPNASQAALDAGYPSPPGSAACRVRGHELTHRDDVLEALNEVAARELRGLVVPAVVALGKLLENEKHPDHKAAALAVLDRTGHGGRTSVDVNVQGTVTVDHTTAAVEDLPGPARASGVLAIHRHGGSARKTARNLWVLGFVPVRKAARCRKSEADRA